MKAMAIVCCITASLFSASRAFGASGSTCTMAEILTNLEHYPNDSQKQQLAEIFKSDDSSEGEQMSKSSKESRLIVQASRVPKDDRAFANPVALQ